MATESVMLYMSYVMTPLTTKKPLQLNDLELDNFLSSKNYHTIVKQSKFYFWECKDVYHFISHKLMVN